MRHYAILFGSGDERQRVQITYDYIQSNVLYSEKRYEVTRLSVLTPLWLTPSDMYTDLQLAISRQLGVHEGQVRIDCEIEEEVNKAMLFVGGAERVPVFA